MVWAALGVLLIVILFAKVRLVLDSVKGRKRIFVFSVFAGPLLVYRAWLCFGVRNFHLHCIQAKRGRSWKHIFRYPKDRKMGQGKWIHGLVDLMWAGGTFRRIAILFHFGEEDAAVTALGCGIITRVLSFLPLGLHSPVEEFFCAGRPHFGENCFYLELKCIFAASLADIIFAKLRSAKEGEN